MHRFAIPVASDLKAEDVAVILRRAHDVRDGHVGHDRSEPDGGSLNGSGHHLLSGWSFSPTPPTLPFSAGMRELIAGTHSAPNRLRRRRSLSWLIRQGQPTAGSESTRKAMIQHLLRFAPVSRSRCLTRSSQGIGIGIWFQLPGRRTADPQQSIRAAEPGIVATLPVRSAAVPSGQSLIARRTPFRLPSHEGHLPLALNAPQDP